MKIRFTKEQYENLIKLVYLGNWMINAIRSGAKGDEIIQKYEDIEQYIYSFAKDFGLEEHIEFDEEFNKFFPTRNFEENSGVDQYRDEYEDEFFWDELIDRFARRDFIKEYGRKVIEKMDFKERIEKEHPFIEKYAEEFQEHGIDRLKI